MKIETLLQLHDELTQSAKKIMVAKNHDYTSGSGDPFANFRGSNYLGIHPVIGIQLRQQDKIQRVKTFVEKGELKVKGESVKDAIVDQINYLVLQYGLIVEQQGLPVEPEGGKVPLPDSPPEGWGTLQGGGVAKPSIYRNTVWDTSEGGPG